MKLLRLLLGPSDCQVPSRPVLLSGNSLCCGLPGNMSRSRYHSMYVVLTISCYSRYIIALAVCLYPCFKMCLLDCFRSRAADSKVRACSKEVPPWELAQSPAAALQKRLTEPPRIYYLDTGALKGPIFGYLTGQGDQSPYEGRLQVSGGTVRKDTI